MLKTPGKKIVFQASPNHSRVKINKSPPKQAKKLPTRLARIRSVTETNEKISILDLIMNGGTATHIESVSRQPHRKRRILMNPGKLQQSNGKPGLTVFVDLVFTGETTQSLSVFISVFPWLKKILFQVPLPVSIYITLSELLGWCNWNKSVAFPFEKPRDCRTIIENGAEVRMKKPGSVLSSTMPVIKRSIKTEGWSL